MCSAAVHCMAFNAFCRGTVKPYMNSDIDCVNTWLNYLV